MTLISVHRKCFCNNNTNNFECGLDLSEAYYRYCSTFTLLLGNCYYFLMAAFFRGFERKSKKRTQFIDLPPL